MVVIDPIRQDGKLIGFAKITRDMTEQRNAQLAALESERKFRLLVQGVTDYAIYMLDPEGRDHELEHGGRAHQGLPRRGGDRAAFLDVLHGRRSRGGCAGAGA